MLCCQPLEQLWQAIREKLRFAGERTAHAPSGTACSSSATSVRSHAPSRTSEELDAEWEAKYWGPVKKISDEALIALATKQWSKAYPAREAPACTVTARMYGSYNAVHIMEFSDGLKVCIRVPACGWIDRWNDIDARLLRDNALTMRMISRETDVPLPKILTYDTKLDNAIGAPYVLMSCLQGRSASDLWDDEGGPTPLEERRQRILRTLAVAMSELRALQFNKTGTVSFPQDSEIEAVVGDSWRLDIKDFDTVRNFSQHPSRSSTRELLRSGLEALQQDLEYPDCHESLKGLYMFMALIVDVFLQVHAPAEAQQETFALMHQDFDIQNILIDETGTVTGILDWDNMEIVPRQIGWCSVPYWLLEDWYTSYRWPPDEGVLETLRPDDFDRYRADYIRYMRETCSGHEECRYTGKSHVYQALFDSVAEYRTAEKFAMNVVRDVLPRNNTGHYIGNLGDFGWREGEKGWMEKRLAVYLAPDPET